MKCQLCCNPAQWKQHPQLQSLVLVTMWGVLRQADFDFFSKNSPALLMYSWTQHYFQRTEFEQESPVKAKMLLDRSDPKRPGYLKIDLYSFRSESALYFNDTYVKLFLLVLCLICYTQFYCWKIGILIEMKGTKKGKIEGLTWKYSQCFTKGRGKNIFFTDKESFDTWFQPSGKDLAGIEKPCSFASHIIGDFHILTKKAAKLHPTKNAKELLSSWFIFSELQYHSCPLCNVCGRTVFKNGFSKQLWDRI